MRIINIKTELQKDLTLKEFIYNDFLKGKPNGMIDVYQDGMINYYPFQNHTILLKIPEETLSAKIFEIIIDEINESIVYYRICLQDSLQEYNEIIIPASSKE